MRTGSDEDFDSDDESCDAEDANEMESPHELSQCDPIIKKALAQPSNQEIWRQQGRCPQCGELGPYVKLMPTCSTHGPY